MSLNRLQLRTVLNEKLNNESFKVLCFELNVEAENLAGETRIERIISLIAHLERNGRLDELIHRVETDRLPNPAAKLTTSLSPRLREGILHNVRSTWIEGVLEQSLHKGIWLQLGLEYQPHAVSRRTVYTGDAETLLPPDKEIKTVFAEAGRKLLILGAPGAGKTMLLLELAKALVTDAEVDSTLPLPFVLNLSSWALAQKPLAEWLVEELHQQYQLSRKVAGDIVAQERLILLLDGLDEVRVEVRPACVAAINTFQAAHQVELVVCSRLEEYEALEEALNVGTAVRILPLTAEQVDEFVSREGLELTAVRATLQTDPTLRELTKTPFFLNIMALAYQGMSLAELKPLATIKARRQHLFQSYIGRTFQHRPLPPKITYTQPQAIRWLTYLAHALSQHNQTIFYIEHFQPTWLPSPSLRHRFRQLSGFIVGLSGALFGVFCIWLIFEVTGGLIDDLIFGLKYRLRDLVITEPIARAIVHFIEVIAMLIAAILMLLRKQSRSEFEKNIVLYEDLHWNPLPKRKLLQKIKKSLFVGLFIGLFVGLFTGFIFGLIVGLVYGLGILFFIWIVSIFVASIQHRQIQKRTHPNQGTIRSYQNSLRMSLIFAIGWGGLVGLGSWLVILLSNLFKHTIQFEFFSGLSQLVSNSLLEWSFYGLLYGLIAGLMFFGTRGVIQHYTLRYLLARANILPFPFSDKKLIAFLDAMADRLILRRVGGGWIFIHRTLLEYFAEQAQKEP